MGDEGLGAEHPNISEQVDKFVQNIDEFGSDELELVRGVLDYPVYKQDLDRTLLQAYPDGKIPVSRKSLTG